MRISARSANNGVKASAGRSADCPTWTGKATEHAVGDHGDGWTRSGLGGLASAGLVITCEHGGNRIPAPYRGLFHGHRRYWNLTAATIPAR